MRNSKQLPISPRGATQIMIGKAVGTKTALYEKVAHGRQDGDQWSSDFGETIEVCNL